MASLGRDIGGEVYAVTNFAGASTGTATAINGAAVDISTLPARAESVLAVVAVVGVLDDADTLTVDTIKLQSSTTSNFASPVDRVAASTVTLTGATGATDVTYRGQASLALDLTQLPESHKYIRLTARPALSDAVNTTGFVAGVLVFGGLTNA